ncbi:SPARC-related modular calcium-binding protein 1 isoform X2 [Anthonomus grandis grandis]|uniref:SPARC-related modular calcium-binding protein 1 isoform X2 n=1 Tax=Anthonomus grandis grandis TaxID=2921223 RepID=UPI002165C53F|nr:SPARC-related modular calcium-binding protein 1 isoform X2 [Anthonomus grandis grandis]
MWKLNDLLFVVAVVFIVSRCAVGSEDSEEPSICTPKACQKSDNQKVVCGSDGLSYPNRCQLERVRCQNGNVTFVKRGPCKRQRSCLEWQDLELDFPQYKFKARCKKNGAYEPGQCHPESGFCWCVTPEGIPLPDTVKEKNTNPDSKPIRCGGGSKRKIPRSSPNRKTKTRACKLTEKSQLNNNIINSFHSEYKRQFGQTAIDQTVVQWKFTSLDANKDESLDRREFRDIKRLVSKAMKPKRCAKNFPKACDVDLDGKITLQEWQDCLSRDGSNLRTDTVAEGPGRSYTRHIEGDDGEDYDSGFDPIPAPPHGVLNPDVSIIPSNPGDYDQMDSKDDEIPGCLTDRKIAQEEPLSYIPECTPDGRYKKVQCFKSVGYCWCVNEDSGKTIAGSAIKDKIPNCTAFDPPPRPMKGCPDDKKIIFLQELAQFFQKKLTENSPNNPAGSLALIQSNKEQQALASFNFLDKNKNKVLDKPEWKAFKEMVVPIKGLKKCGKKLPRYCDSNQDRQITSVEWLDCLNIQALISAQTSVSTTKLSKTNPLSLLKDD